jgi:sterol desaturase/sphingolipid hydroxylase (fatty acid hydroxylase superfamily)
MRAGLNEARAMSEPSAKSDQLRASPRMFRSSLLDFFSRVHPSVPFIIFIPLIVLMEAWALRYVGVLALIGLTALGYVLWTLLEYCMHRFVFHFEPEHGIGARLHWIIHGIHHDHPNDPLRLVMPPAVSVPLAALFFGIFELVFGHRLAPAVSAGLFIGYVIYDGLHYYLHHARPHGRLGRALRELHMRHHFQDHTRGFGISAPYWDHVFRTAHVRRRSRGGPRPAPTSSPGGRPDAPSAQPASRRASA